ncbi:hypothetical protein QQ045_007779 [Rhodiola kirilowii]
MSPLAILIAMSFLLLPNGKAESDCTPVLVSLSPCLNYVAGNSSAPSASCCSQLAAVVRSKPECLCSVLDGSADASLGIKIDKNLALELPNACNVKTPPVTKCEATGGAEGETDGIPPQTSAAGEGSDTVRMSLKFAVVLSTGIALWSF